MSAKTRQLQGQISRVLFAQAFVPFATIVVPFSIDILSIYCGLYFADSGLVLLAITAWAPVVNPVVTFCVVGQYRQAAVAFMQKLTTFTSANSTTSDGKTFSFSGAVLPTPKTGLLIDRHRESLSTRLLGGSTSLGGARRPSTLELTKTFIGP
uniref:G protein-coupled receptor n=1 Tax=Panagrellus redivivus TaxID=6233 RepID=A0A7E4VRT7_PANRE